MTSTEEQTSVNLSEFVGKDLTGFQIIRMTEVYATNEDGRKTRSIGYFKDAKIAAAYVETHKKSDYLETSEEYVLTNGTVGFVIESVDSIKLFDDEQETVKLREEVLSKLSSAERAILGFA